MANSALNIIIDAQYPGGRIVKEARTDIRNLEQSSGGAGSALRSLAGNWQMMVGAAAGAAVVVRQFYSELKEGADLQIAAERFDKLTASIGTTSSALLTDMKRATGGMVTDAELVASASDLINFGLAKNHDQVVRLSSAVGRLGLPMQQVLLTMANDSTMRLDALGLSVEDVRAKVEKLKASGFKGDAFDEAVLLALEDKMALLGDASETTAGKISILQSRFANLHDEMKKGIAERWEPYLDILIYVTNESDKAADSITGDINGMVQADIARAKTAQEVARQISLAKQLEIDKTLILADANSDMIAMLASGERGIRTFNYSLLTHAQRLQMAAGIARRELNPAIRESTSYFEDEQYASGAAADAVSKQAAAAKESAAATTDAAKAALEYNKALGNIFTGALNSRDALVRYVHWARYSDGLNDDQKASLEELRREYDRTNASIRSYTSGVESLSGKEEDRAEKIKELTEYSNQLAGAIGNLEAGQSQVVASGARFAVNVSAAKDSLFGMLQQAGAAPGVLAAFSVEMGLASKEAALAAMRTTILQTALQGMAESAMEDGRITREELTNIRSEFDELITTIDTMPVILFESDGADDVIQKASAIQQLLANITGTHHVDIVGNASDFFNGGGRDTSGGKDRSVGSSGMGGGTTNVNVNVNGPVSSKQVAQDVADAMGAR